MTGWMLGVVLGLGPAQAQDDEPLYMADLGLNVTIPRGFRVPRWSDWDLDGVDKSKSIQIRLISTAFQQEPTEEAAQAWANQVVTELEAGDHTGARVVSSGVETLNGRSTALAEIRYRHKGKDDAVLVQRSFPLQGKVAHLRATGLTRNTSKVRRALATWDMGLALEKAPMDLEANRGPLVSESAFRSTLPEGWRHPLVSELGPVREVAAKAGQGKIDKDRCWVAIKPYPEGDTAILLACQQGAWVGKIDEHSFEGKQEELKSLLFGEMEVGHASPLGASPDGRMSPMYTLSGSSDLAVRVAATPYDRGLMTTYAIGRLADGDALEAALVHVLEDTTFAGPDGGAHPVSFLNLVDYAVKYRPVFLAPLLLVLLVVMVLVFKLATKKPSYVDVD